MKCKCPGGNQTPIVTPLKSLKSPRPDFIEEYCEKCNTRIVHPMKKSSGPFPTKDVGIF